MSSLAIADFEDEVAACDLELLHEIGGPGEQYAPAVFNQSEAERRRQMRFSAARRAETQKIGALFDPGISGGERLHLRFGDHRHGVEVERVEGFSRRQPRFREIPLEAASASLDHLLFGESGEEASGGPAFLVGGRGESSPDKPDAGKTQLAEQQVDASGSILSLVFMPPLPETRRSRRR